MSACKCKPSFVAFASLCMTHQKHRQRCLLYANLCKLYCLSAVPTGHNLSMSAFSFTLKALLPTYLSR